MEALPWIAAGGALGALVRGGLATTAHRLASRRRENRGVSSRAAATLIANGLGCFLLALWLGSPTGGIGAESTGAAPGGLHALVTTGLCGGLTTFSTLCADAHRIRTESARPRRAFLYLAVTVLTGWIGFQLGAHLALALLR